MIRKVGPTSHVMTTSLCPEEKLVWTEDRPCASHLDAGGGGRGCRPEFILLSMFCLDCGEGGRQNHGVPSFYVMGLFKVCIWWGTGSKRYPRREPNQSH